MLLERRVVSRKTPNDGKLEISRAMADAMAPLGPRLTVGWAGSDAPAALVEMACTCAKGSGQHQHVFLHSDLLRSLDAGTEVDLRIDAGSGRVSVTQAPR
jgi:hypothetical protein